MAESAHRVQAVSGPTIYPAPDPAEAIADYSLRAAIFGLCDRLQAATEEYAVVSADLADALAGDADARLNLDYLEGEFRTRAYNDGLPGTNEAQRLAYLAVRLADDPTVDEARQARDAAHRARLQAEHRFRVVDMAVKSLRGRLAALTALVESGR